MRGVASAELFVMTPPDQGHVTPARNRASKISADEGVVGALRWHRLPD